MTLRIAVDVTPMQTAHRLRGIGRYVGGLIRGLNQQDEVPLTFVGWKSELDLDPIHPHELRLLPQPPMPQYIGAWLFAQTGMAVHLATRRYNGVHITAPEALIRSKRAPVLTTVYDLIPLHEGISALAPIRRLGYRRYLHALQGASTHFAISEQTAESLRAFLGRSSSILMTPPGIDLPNADGIPALHPTDPFFLFVGGPNANKNLEVLLLALSMAHGSPETLLIAGTWLPKHKKILGARLISLGLTDRVRHLGQVSDEVLWGLMRHATAVIVPSSEEGFGLPVAEAIAAGAVLIYSDIPVFVSIARGNGLSFSANSSTELREQMDRVSAQPGLRLALRRRTQAPPQALKWDATIATTLGAYKRWMSNQ